MAIEEYVVGEPVRIKGFFFNDPEETDPVNPGVVQVSVEDPAHVDVIYTGTIDNDDEGVFSQVVETPLAGDWHYRWETSSPTCVVQGMFTVYEKNV